MRPFSIKIFVPDGNPDGLRIIEKSNWTGVGLFFNRSVFAEARKRPEFDRTGVYMLVGNSADSSLPMVYIGEAEAVGERLKEHYSKKDFWDWAIFFASKDTSLNKAHVRYLESRLIELATKAKQCKLDNGKDSSRPNLTEADQADIESFLEDMLSIFPLVNLSVFEQAADQKKPAKDKLLYISGKGLTGTGYESAKGFVVCKGTQSPVKSTTTCSKAIVALRKDLVDNGILQLVTTHYEFAEDYVFNSPSMAASLVLGRSANGRTEWKNKDGKTLKELQEAEAD